VKEIKSGKYDFGVAYDGDADRIVAVDENGGIIRSDILMTLFLPEVIQNDGRNSVINISERIIPPFSSTATILSASPSYATPKSYFPDFISFTRSTKL
jgi:phosphomannomutase